MNPFEMQNYERMQDEFEIVAFAPHETRFDLSAVALPQEILWCPIAGKTPFERPRRKWMALQDRVTGNTHSFCGLADRLKGFDNYHIKDQPLCFSYEAALAKRKWGGRLLVTQMENIPFLNDNRLMERQTKRAVREQTDLFLPANEAAARTLRLEGAPESKIRMISNGVDVRHFKPGPKDPALAASLGLPEDAFVALYVGRLAKSKGIFTLLEAAKAILARDPKLHLLLVGKDEESVMDWARARGLGPHVHHAGFVSYDQMPRYYRLAQISVLPSIPTRGWIEQCPFVLLEAMACGVPPMGSNCGGIPESIGDDARVFEPGSVEGLAKVLTNLRAAYSPRLCRAVRDRAVKLYSTDVLTQKLRAIYREALALPAGGGTA